LYSRQVYEALEPLDRFPGVSGTQVRARKPEIIEHMAE